MTDFFLSTLDPGDSVLTLNFHSLNLGDKAVRARFGGMYQSFFRALEGCGCRVVYTPSGPLRAGDVAIVPLGGGQEYESLGALRSFSGPAVLYAPPAHEWFDRRVLEYLAPKALFAYGTDTSDHTADAYESIGIPYMCLPFGSEPDVMKPLPLPRQYDVVFVGSLSHARRRAEYLVPLLEAFGRERVLVLGSGWEQFGVAEQQVEWGPLLNIVYNLATVCVNVHGSTQVLGPHRQLDANNRLFDLAMAGCCQVCDCPSLVTRYFSVDEVAAAENPRSWLDQVRHFVSNPELAKGLGIRARRRASAHHTWHARGLELAAAVKMHYSTWSPEAGGESRAGLALQARWMAQRLRRSASRRWIV